MLSALALTFMSHAVTKQAVCCDLFWSHRIYRVFHDLWTLLQGGGFLGLCDQKSSHKHVSILDGYGVTGNF